MAPPNPKHVTTDHVNYLIWSYLQENGFGEAAVKFEQKWNDDPRKLPFANNIGLKALQHLVQKGLELNAIQQQVRNPDSGEPASALTLFFGTPQGRQLSSSWPTRKQSVPPAAAAAAASRGPRKHGRVPATTNGLSLELPAAKRARRSGTEASTNGESMQIDQNGFQDTDRAENESDTNNDSPAERGQSANGMEIDDDLATPSPEPILTLNIGESKGTHIDQPVDLADKISIHSLSSSNQVITYLAYNPQDPDVLATGGEALARIWQPAKSLAGPLEAPHLYNDILPPSDDSYVSAEAWSPDGEVIAIASRNASSSQLAGAVSLWTSQGTCLEELPATQELIFKLRWNPAGTHLLGVTSSGMTSTSVVVWEAESPTTSQPCEVQKELRDIIWTSDTQFAVCGKGIIATSTTSPTGTLTLQSSADSEVESRTWTHIAQDTFSTNFIAADESGCLALISRQGDLQSTREAHYGELTGLELRPSSKLVTARADSTKLLATSGMEGTVKLWDATNLESLATLSFGFPASPVMSLNFTPNGHFLAAGNPNRIFIWNPDDMGPPKATWKREAGKGPQKKTLHNGNTNGVNGHHETAMDYDSAMGDDAEDEGRCLSWDAEGKKLAMGVGSQFLVVDFGP